MALWKEFMKRLKEGEKYFPFWKSSITLRPPLSEAASLEFSWSVFKTHKDYRISHKIPFLFGGTPLYRLLGTPLSRSASLSTLTKYLAICERFFVPKRKNTSGWERERECMCVRLLASSLTLLLTALLLSSCSTDEQYRSLPEVVQVERVVPYHIVSGGESVGTIAEKYSMTRTELIKLNGLSPPYQLYSGQRLVINVKVEDSSSTQADSDVVVVEEKTKPEKKEQAGDEIERPKLENEQPIQEQESDAPQIVEEESSDYVWPIADGQNKIIQNFNDSSDGEVILKASAGTPVKAVTDGTVRIAKTLDGEASSYGKTVIILHNKKNKLSVYSHLQEYSVSAGQKIKKGAVIGKVGKSGNAKSPQLHLQIFDVNRKDKTRTPVDPEKILP